MIRANVKVYGIVQGVGFRPFIHKQISDKALNGWIRNTYYGAEIELEGEEKLIDEFSDELWTKTPVLAIIEDVKLEKFSELKHYPDFKIIPGDKSGTNDTLIPPDVCICDDCLREMFDPSDRRYRYPFLNCTNCGPRFTIIEDIPYHRSRTTMKDFPMCEECNSEYTTIEDRRYNAEPTCCPDCGPVLQFYDAEGKLQDGDPLALAQEYLKDGKIVAVKGLGGIHLACRADDPELAAELRRRKHRDEKPLALMCNSVEAARKLCEISPEEEKILDSFRRPIVLLRKNDLRKLDYISENNYIGIMLCYTPMHYLLFDGAFDTLIMTSANLSDVPTLYRDEDALSQLRGVADGFLLNNREIFARCDDSLVYVRDGKEYFLRRSRGYVPQPLSVPETESDNLSVLACGAEQKASFCLSKQNHVFLSQHIGDLKNIESYDGYVHEIDHFKHIFGIEPDAVACDLHPDYMSSSYASEVAEEKGIPLITVQHHHAHMCSCMADNKLNEKVLGIIWDGTGLGTDGTIWGGEFLAGDYSGFERVARIKPIKLPGGDRVTKEIWRVGISLLVSQGLDPSMIYSEERVSKVKAQLEAGINVPVASSMGRLFDGVASILGIKDEASYEGQAAVLLEAHASSSENTYPFEIKEVDGIYEFDYQGVILSLLFDVLKGEDTHEIAACFMNTLVQMASEMCYKLYQKTGLTKVCLSGGTFQNMYLLKHMTGALEAQGFSVYRHVRVSANDEGLSLGQMMVAKNVLGSTTQTN